MGKNKNIKEYLDKGTYINPEEFQVNRNFGLGKVTKNKKQEVWFEL